MRRSRALILSCLALTPRGSWLKYEQPNPDYPGTRDILFPSGGQDADPIYIAVPNEFSLDQIAYTEIAGSVASFSNGETWVTIGGKRALRFAKDIYSETKALQKGFSLSNYPVVTSGEELDALLAKDRPLEELQAAVAERHESRIGGERMQSKRILMFGCPACRCLDMFDGMRYC